MFKDITTAYDGTNATWEIIVMLSVAFLLGYLLKKVLNSNGKRSTLTTAGSSESIFAKYATDDLKIVEGIGPKIEELLKENGIKNWNDLTKVSTTDLKEILKKGGDRFAMHDPSSWVDQASLAYDGKWSELEKFQDLLVGGKAS